MDKKISVTTKAVALMLGVEPQIIEDNLDLLRLLDKTTKSGTVESMQILKTEYISRIAEIETIMAVNKIMKPQIDSKNKNL